MLVLSYSESELNSICLVGFLSLLGWFWNFLRVSINHLYRLGKPNQPVHLVQFDLTGSLGGLICLCWFLVIRVRIELRLSCWIPESFRKVLEFFESLYQPSVSVGKTKPAGSFGSVCWNGSLGGLICSCWFLVIRSRN